MFLVRLFFLILVGITARRLYRAFKGKSAGKGFGQSETVHTPGADQTSSEPSDLTEQGIDDADFEEIP